MFQEGNPQPVVNNYGEQALDQYLFRCLIAHFISNEKPLSRLLTITCAEFGKNVREVILHRLWADMEPYTDLLVTHPLSKERQNC